MSVLSPDLIEVTKKQTVAGTVVDGVLQPELTIGERAKIVDLNTGSLQSQEFDMDKIRDLWKKQSNGGLSQDDRDYLRRFNEAQPLPVRH